MTTSGSFNWELERDELITAALRKLGVVAQGKTASADQITEGAEALNTMIKEWQNDGVRLWTLEWIARPLDTASSEVTGTDSLIYTCILGHTSSSENKPVTGSNWSTFWRQTGSTGGAWANATAYTSIGDTYPGTDTLGIEKAFIREDGNDHPVRLVGWHTFLDIMNKYENTGRPTHLLFDRMLPPRMALYPTPDVTTYVLHYLRVRMLEDFDASTDTPDAPPRWTKAIVYGLASDLAHDYGIRREERIDIDAKAVAFYERAKVGDRERTDENFVLPAYTP
jgi:hypothetical protein